MKLAPLARLPIEHQSRVVAVLACASLLILLAPSVPDVWQRLSTRSVPWEETQQLAGLRQLSGQPFTGAVITHHPNGRIALRENYRAGQRHGLSERWGEDGRLIEQRRYADGDKVGKHQGWWPSGAKRFEMHFEQGVLQGAVEYWHANGFMASRLQFVNGRESGPQRTWKSDGTSESAYDMIDGRRYGVIDSTPCPTLPNAAVKLPSVASLNTIKSVAPRAVSMPAIGRFDAKNVSPLPFYTDASFAPQWLPESTDSVHQLGVFRLVNQAKQPVQASQLAGGLTVVNFFFAGCSQVCPASIAFLREIQQDIAKDVAKTAHAQALKFWAISIDPLSDTPEALASYAQRMQLLDWQLLTGTPDEVDHLATQSFFAKSRLEAHTERAYLIDDQRRIRGIYNATQRGDLLRLREDVLRLQRMAQSS
jgi:cytochrome oxidase Cu insertion factor (SCO1/SenC/PrrC family)